MKRRLQKAAAFLRERYFTIDARTLGLFRIGFGLLLIANVYDRTKGPDAVAFYTNDGVLPNHYALFAPMGERLWSLLFPFSTAGEVQVAFALILLAYAAYTLGYRTKLSQILVVVCLLSLDNRNLTLQNGGIVVTNVVAVWTAFLPLGARFSLDQLLRSLKERREATPAELNDRGPMVRSAPRYARFAFFGILLNFVAIYFFNFAHKKGLTWREGSAVHWVLWQNRIATIWAAWIRMHEPAWFSPFATRATLGIEAAIPVWLILPMAQKWTRRVAILSIWALHCGISLMMTLGPFSYSMMAFSLLLIGEDDWKIVERLFSHNGPKVSVIYDASSRIHDLARVLARLDLRNALEFVDRRDVARQPFSAEALERVEGCPLVVFDAPRQRWEKGTPALATMVRVLPFGFLYAWPFRLSFVRSRLDRTLETVPGARGRAASRPFVEAPVTRFRRATLRVSGELLAALLFATLAVQVASDNWAIPNPYRLRTRPRFMREIVDYMRLPQGWSMFSPDAPRDDGTIVIDALLSDGRHLDPRKQKPPDFEAAFHGPWFDDQQWCDWDLRMKFEGNRHLYPYFREYIARLDDFPSWRQNATITYFEVYWVNNAAPPPGSTQPYNLTRQLLFSGGVRP
ncbi:MAG TPA: HTTM domain-containing protein [Polyangiaceae bacterium]